MLFFLVVAESANLYFVTFASRSVQNLCGRKGNCAEALCVETTIEGNLVAHFVNLDNFIS